eukprot:1239045-Prymnesium_polylepis.1
MSDHHVPRAGPRRAPAAPPAGLPSPSPPPPPSSPPRSSALRVLSGTVLAPPPVQGPAAFTLQHLPRLPPQSPQLMADAKCAVVSTRRGTSGKTHFQLI